MTKTIIHVNRQNIAINNKVGKQLLPTYIVRKGNKSTYGYGVEILGPCTMVDRRDPKNKELKCGAKAWMETDSEVKIIGPMQYSKVKEKWDNFKKKNPKYA